MKLLFAALLMSGGISITYSEAMAAQSAMEDKCDAANSAVDYPSMTVYCSEAAQEQAVTASGLSNGMERDTALILESAYLVRTGNAYSSSGMDRPKGLAIMRNALAIEEELLPRHPSMADSVDQLRLLVSKMGQS